MNSSMYDFILQIALFASLGIVVYLFARGVARAGETASVTHRVGFFDRLLSRLPLEKVDEALNVFSEKFLRRTRVFILRADNWVNSMLSKVKRQNGERAGEAKAGGLFPGKEEGSSLDETGGVGKE